MKKQSSQPSRSRDKDYKRQKSSYRLKNQPITNKNRLKKQVRTRDFQRSRRKQDAAVKRQQKIMPRLIENRNEVCPFLVKIYYEFNSDSFYRKFQDLPKDHSLTLYLWMSSSLKQIAQLLRAHLPLIRTREKFIFSRLICQRKQQKQNIFITKQQMGVIIIKQKDSLARDTNHQLFEYNFNIGDLIHVSIYHS